MTYDPNKSRTIISSELAPLIIKFREKQEPETFCQILLLIDPLILRIVNQLVKKVPHLRDCVRGELYHTAIVATHKAICEFEIRDEKSIYSFPMQLKGKIIYAFKRTFFPKEFYVPIEEFEHFRVNTQWQMPLNESALRLRMVEEALEYLVKNRYVYPKIKSVIMLRLAGKTHKEVAKITGIPFGTVKYYAVEGIKSLKRLFKKGTLKKEDKHGKPA